MVSLKDKVSVLQREEKECVEIGIVRGVDLADAASTLPIFVLPSPII